MHIGIITFHAANNYGAFLQAYSLLQKLNSFENMDADIIDYICPQIENHYKISSLFRGNENIIRKLVKSALRMPSIINQQKVFSTCREKNLRIKYRRIGKKNLSGIVSDYDMFIVGSDQVWNNELIHGDLTYFLDFVSDNHKKKSYAISMGNESLSSFSEEQLKLISEFDCICVRERSLFQLLNQHISEEKLECCIDPVFLTPQNNWRTFSKCPSHQKYVLIFVMGTGSYVGKLVEFGINLAKKKHLEALFLSDQDRWYKFRNIPHLKSISPEQFVGLIDNADYVVTNSFHGTCMSIILHTPFYVETAIKRSGRVMDILSRFNLLNRALSDGTSVVDDEGEIIWNEVDGLIRNEVDHAEEYLNRIMSDKRRS